MFHMFSWCESLHSLGLSGFDISRATTLEQQFYGIEDVGFSNQLDAQKIGAVSRTQ